MIKRFTAFAGTFRRIVRLVQFIWCKIIFRTTARSISGATSVGVGIRVRIDF